MIRHIGLALVVLLYSAPLFPASAQDAQAPASSPSAISDPCRRAAARAVIGGVDLDETRCVLFLAQQGAGRAASVEMQMQAKLILMQGDLLATRQRLADFEAYAKACGDQAGCFVPVAEKP